MSQPLLDVNPVSFRAYFAGSSRYQIVTTVLDNVAYHTVSKRKQLLHRLKSDSLTGAVEDEIRAVCRELLAGSDCPEVVHQRLTTILISRNSAASGPTPSGCHQPRSCTLVVTVNPEGTADRLWGRVASRLHEFTVHTDRRAASMAPPRRSRRLSIQPEPAAAQPPSSRARPAGRGSRTSRPTSPARRPASPGAGSRPAARRARGATASPPASTASQRATKAAAAASAAAAARKTTTVRKKVTSPASTVSTTSTVSRRSIVVRSSRRSVAVSSPPALAASRRQTSSRRSKAATPPRKSSLSPVKERIARATREIRSPSFAREIRVRTLRGLSDEMTDFNLPEGMTGSKSTLLEELMANPTVVLETPGVLKRFSKKLRESTPKAKSPSKSPERAKKSDVKPPPDATTKRRRDSPEESTRKAKSPENSPERAKKPDAKSSPDATATKRRRGSPEESTRKAKPPAKSPERGKKSDAKSSLDAKAKRRRDSPAVRPVSAVGERTTRTSKTASPVRGGKDSPEKLAARRGRSSVIEKRARAESRSPSATPPKKTRVTSAESTSRATASAAAAADSPTESLIRRARPSLASVRKSLNASLIAVPKAASSPASPELRIHTPAARRPTAAKAVRTITEVSQSVTAVPKSVTEVSKSVTEMSKTVTGIPESITSVSKSVASVSKSVTAVSKSVAEPTEVMAGRPSRRSTAAPPPSALESPERAAGMKALLAARSSIRRRPAGQPPPEDVLSASPNLKPAREAAAAALDRAYVALARSEAKQKDLFLTRVSEAAAAASPALAKPVEKSASEKPITDETPVNATSKKSSLRSQVAAQVVAEQPPPVKPVSSKPPAETAPEKPAAERSDAVDGDDAIFASPAGRGTPRGQLAPRSSVRRAPASALRRVLDRAPPDSAARPSVRRAPRMPSPPPGPDQAAGGDSPLVEPRVTRARRAKLASEIPPPADVGAMANSVNAAGAVKQPPPGVTQLSAENKGTERPQRRGRLHTACLMLLLLLAVVLGVLWLARGQLPPEQQQRLEQLQLSVEQQGRQLAGQLEQLVYRQTEAVRGWWLARQQATDTPPVPAPDQ